MFVGRGHACRHVYMCIDMCAGMFVGMCIGMCIDTCLGRRPSLLTTRPAGRRHHHLGLRASPAPMWMASAHRQPPMPRARTARSMRRGVPRLLRRRYAQRASAAMWTVGIGTTSKWRSGPRGLTTVQRGACIIIGGGRSERRPPPPPPPAGPTWVTCV